MIIKATRQLIRELYCSARASSGTTNYESYEKYDYSIHSIASFLCLNAAHQTRLVYSSHNYSLSELCNRISRAYILFHYYNIPYALGRQESIEKLNRSYHL